MRLVATLVVIVAGVNASNTENSGTELFAQLEVDTVLQSEVTTPDIEQRQSPKSFLVKFIQFLNSRIFGLGDNGAVAGTDSVEYMVAGVMESLGWDSYPTIDMRVHAELLKPSGDLFSGEEEPEHEAFAVMAASKELYTVQEILKGSDSSSRLLRRSPSPPAVVETAHWIGLVHEHAAAHGLEVPLGFEHFQQILRQIMLEPQLDTYAYGSESLAVNVDEVEDQIRRDIDRPWVLLKQGMSFSDIEIIKADCLEVSMVYALGFNPSMGYSQGMVDLCFFFKSVGQMSNSEAFDTLVVITEQITKMYNTASRVSSFARSHALAQLYSHMLKNLDHRIGGIFEELENAAVQAMQIRWEMSAGALQEFLLGFGTLTKNEKYSPLDMAPIVDFLLHTGRPGLIAIFFANIQANHDTMLSPIRHSPMGCFTAVQLLKDPLAVGSLLTPASLVAAAAQILHSNVGRVSFAVAVEVMDAIAEANAREA